MDDRLARHFLEDNLIERVQDTLDRVSLLEKLSLTTTSAPGGGLITVGAPANGLTLYGQVLSLATPGSDTNVIFNDGGVYGAESSLTFDKSARKLYIGDGTASPLTGGMLDIVKVDTFENTPVNLFARSDDGYGALNFIRYRAGVFELLENDVLGGLDFYGYDGDLTGIIAQIQARAATDFSTGIRPTELSFSVTGGYLGPLTEMMRIDFEQTNFYNYIKMNGFLIKDAADPMDTQDLTTKGYVDALVVGLWDDRGNFDASVNAYPSSGGSGAAGAILKGDIWMVSVAGTLPTAQDVEPGDTVRALVDSPGNTQPDWAIQQNNLALPLSPANGGTGISNAGTLTVPANVSITGGGTLALGGFTGTLSATGTFALLEAANVFTANQIIEKASGISELGIYSYRDSAATHARVEGRAARGTKGAETALIAGDKMFYFSALGWTSAGAWGSETASVQINAAENFTATAQGSQIEFWTTPLLSSTTARRLTINPAGNVGIGIASPRSRLSFGTTGAVSTADTIRLYDDGVNNWYSTGVDSANSALRLTAGTGGYIAFFTGASGGTEKARMTTAGNVLIGTTSDLTNGGKLQVVGAADAIQAIFRAWSTQTNNITEWQQNSGGTVLTYINGVGNLGVRMGATAATALLHIAAGTTAASTAPLKFTSGSLMTTPEALAVEALTDALYVTTTTNTKRRMIVAGTTGRATGQTAANTSVATYTLGATDASYEVSANVLITTSSAENFTVTVDYTDEGNTARTMTLNFETIPGVLGTAINFANGAVPYAGVPAHIRCKASTAITVKTTGTFTGATYNVEGIIKQTA